MPRAHTPQRRAHAQIGGTVRQGTAEQLAAAVSTGAVHVALTFQDAGLPRREHRGTTRQDLWDEPFVALVTPTHELAERPAIRLAELRAEPWIIPSTTGLIARACRQARFEPRVAVLATEPLATRGLVAAGLGVSLTSAGLARRLSGVRALALQERVERSVYALTPPSGTRPVATELVRCVVRAARTFASS